MSLISSSCPDLTIQPSPFYFKHNKRGLGTSVDPLIHVPLIKREISSRLREFKDTVRLIIFTLDIMTQNSTIITSVQGLPHDAFSLLPCSTTFGGVVVITSNSVIYVDQSSRRVGLQVNGWATRISDLGYPPLGEEDISRKLTLEGCRSIIVDDKTVFLVLKDGTVHPVELVADGKTVSKLSISPALAQTTIPAVVKRVDEDHIFIGSTVGPSILLKTAHVEQEVEEEQGPTSGPAVVTQDVLMDDDDDGEWSLAFTRSNFDSSLRVDIYGDSQMEAEPTTNGVTHVKKTKTVIHLSLRDYLPAYGPISSMTFSLAMNGVRYPSYMRLKHY